jgi:Phytanoyl-CoA dioxygenase (PhyH)
MITDVTTDKSMSGQLREQGYLVIPGFLPDKQVESLRGVCERLTGGNGVAAMTASVFLATPDLTQVVFSKVTLELCKELLAHDSFVLYPNLTVRANAATDWHIDAAFKDGLAGIQSNPDFLQCAVYLQDNQPREGGGIDVVPRSHVRLQSGGCEYVPAASLNIEMQARRVDSHAGDLVVWDARLLHRSSLRTAHITRDKLAIHWTVSRSTSGAVQFLEHLVRRGVARSNMNPDLIKRYQDIADIRYPDYIPTEACSALKDSNIFFATLAWATDMAKAHQAEQVVA